jgi:gamma-glutamyl-gamma-aminobutyrate hydrolase PuuD
VTTGARKVLVGLSPRILRHVPAELGFRNKTLQYLEQTMAHSLMEFGAVVMMIPTVERFGEIRPDEVQTGDYVAALDALILQGGADIDPALYGEPSQHVVGPVDPVRDRFELQLLRGFAAAGKPVLGVCRGMQLINVAFGGALHQDLRLAGLEQLQHRVPDLYDRHVHEVELVDGGWLASIYRGTTRARVNSIHHQGIKRLGAGLEVVATSPDGVIEAIHHPGHEFLAGVQWHPEFHDPRDHGLLPTEPLINALLGAAACRRDLGRAASRSRAHDRLTSRIPGDHP